MMAPPRELMGEQRHGREEKPRDRALRAAAGGAGAGAGAGGGVRSRQAEGGRLRRAAAPRDGGRRRCRRLRSRRLPHRSEEHTSELQSLMRTSSAVFCLKKKKKTTQR